LLKIGIVFRRYIGPVYDQFTPGSQYAVREGVGDGIITDCGRVPDL
jgi:hypothetical protein